MFFFVATDTQLKNQQTVGKNWGPTFLFPSWTKGYFFYSGFYVAERSLTTATVWINCEKICKHLQLKTCVSSQSDWRLCLDQNVTMRDVNVSPNHWDTAANMFKQVNYAASMRSNVTSICTWWGKTWCLMCCSPLWETNRKALADSRFVLYV